MIVHDTQKVKKEGVNTPYKPYTKSPADVRSHLGLSDDQKLVSSRSRRFLSTAADAALEAYWRAVYAADTVNYDVN